MVYSMLNTGLENTTNAEIDTTTDNNTRGSTRSCSRNNFVGERHLTVDFYIVQQTGHRLSGITITSILNLIVTFLTQKF